jgi:predicted ATPase/tetratricopeptide (TPR) repeat protein
MSGSDKDKSFGARLQWWRQARRITQQQLAEQLGYDVTYVTKIEGGTRPPSRAFLSRLAQIAGGEQVASLVRPALGDLDRAPLPQPPDQLIGRADEIGAVSRLLQGPARCVTVVGPPGIGKTRLANEIGLRFDTVMSEGVWWVPLVDARHPDEVIGRLARAVGVIGGDGDDQMAAVTARLENQQTLVVFDNFEHVVAARGVISRLVAGTSRVKVLVTSREALELLAEYVVPLGPLPYPDPASAPTFEAVGDSDAVSLFVSRARMARPQFQLTSTNYGVALRVCARLEGVPLSILLAAGAMKVIDVAGLAEHLDQRLDVVYGGPSDLPAGQASMTVAVARSWDRLSGPERQLLMIAAVFSGGFTVAALADVMTLDERDVGRDLAGLQRKSLIEAQPDAPGGPRFAMLEAIRTFAATRGEVADQLDAAREAHARFFARFGAEAGRGLIGGKQIPSVRSFRDERENLQAALDWSLGHDPAPALAIAAGTWRFFVIGDIPVGRGWLEAALAAAWQPTPLRAAALAAAGALGWMTGNPEVATQYLADARRLAEQMGLDDVVALVAANEAALREQQNRLGDARDSLEEALEIYRRLGDPRGRAVALNGLGMLARRRGAVDEAWRLWTDAAALFRHVGDGMNLAIALGNKAWVAETAGRLEEAAEICDQCRRIQIALGDTRGLAATTAALGRLAFAVGDLDTALRLQREALGAFRVLGDLPWLVATLVALSAIDAAVGDLERAVRLMGAAVTVRDSAGLGPREEERDLQATTAASCRATLGGDRFERLWAEGQGLSVEEAVALTLGNGSGVTVPL